MRGSPELLEPPRRAASGTAPQPITPEVIHVAAPMPIPSVVKAAKPADQPMPVTQPRQPAHRAAGAAAPVQAPAATSSASAAAPVMQPPIVQPPPPVAPTMPIAPPPVATMPVGFVPPVAARSEPPQAYSPPPTYVPPPLEHAPYLPPATISPPPGYVPSQAALAVRPLPQLPPPQLPPPQLPPPPGYHAAGRPTALAQEGLGDRRRHVGVIGLGAAIAATRGHDVTVKDAMVRVTTPSGTGAGFFIEGPDEYAYVATANHVVDRGERVLVERDVGTDKRAFVEAYPETEIVASDPDADLAIIRIKNVDASRFSHLTLAKEPTKDEKILSYGYPGSSLAKHAGPVSARTARC